MSLTRHAVAELDLGAVILTHARPAHLEKCLQSVLGIDGLTASDIVVVDQSRAGYTTDFEADPRWRHIRFIRRANEGFGAGMNAGVAATDRRFVMLSNDDFVYDQGYARAGVEWLRAHPRAAMVGGPIAIGPQRDQTFTGATMRRRFDRWVRDDLHSIPTSPRRLDFYIGGAGIHRRSAYQSVKGFDPIYFIYYEDNDLCLKYRANGWQIWLVPTMRMADPNEWPTNRTAERLGPINHARFQLRWLGPLRRLLFAVATFPGLIRAGYPPSDLLRLTRDPWTAPTPRRSALPPNRNRTPT